MKVQISLSQEYTVGEVLRNCKTLLKDRYAPDEAGVIIARGLTASKEKFPITLVIAIPDPENPTYSNIYVVPRGYQAEKGMIFRDIPFLRSVRALLADHHVPGTDTLEYDERGMQGDNYVAFEAERELTQWLTKTYGEQLR